MLNQHLTGLEIRKGRIEANQHHQHVSRILLEPLTGTVCCARLCVCVCDNHASDSRMKVFENNFTYDYSFPAVSLAFFLRYPNPYSRHVLTADVLDRHVDPHTQRLHTTRLLLKRSKVPRALLKLLPASISADKGGAGQSYILETSVVDVREGWMQTESRNMEWTGVLSVVERQDYYRQPSQSDHDTIQKGRRRGGGILDLDDSQCTAVNTTVTFRSRLGQHMLGRRKDQDSNSEKENGWLASWSTAGLQRTVELIGLRRTRDAVFRSKQGMNVVLERLRNGGLVAVMEGMQRDRMNMDLGIESTKTKTNWRQVWQRGRGADHDDD